eukprot:scaffold62393_cov31-Tisochrysis_lutea.AAC.4
MVCICMQLLRGDIRGWLHVLTDLFASTNPQKYFRGATTHYWRLCIWRSTNAKGSQYPGHRSSSRPPESVVWPALPQRARRLSRPLKWEFIDIIGR